MKVYNKTSNNIKKSGNIIAPYNFIGLNDKIFPAYDSINDLPEAGLLSDKLLSGEIMYTITTKSPVLTEKHYGYDRTSIITSSSIRGLVRSNLQILGFSSLIRDIEDRTFKYRAFKRLNNNVNSINYQNKMSDTVYIDRGKRIVVGKIKAGIMGHDADGYYIRKSSSVNDSGYFTINLRLLQKNKNWRNNFCVKHRGVPNIFDTVQNTIDSKSNLSFGTRIGKSLKTPFIKIVSWSGDTVVHKIGEIDVFSRKAYLLNSGYIYGNVTLYLIPYNEEDRYNYRNYIYRLSDDDVENYMNSNSNNNGFYELPNLNNEKPVFYIQEDGKYEFGFTKFFPIKYKNSIHKGIPKRHNTFIIDYDRAIFGFREDKNKYKGRVAFHEPIVENASNVNKVLTSPIPKAHSNLFYTDSQDGAGYGSDSFTIKGIKQYWLHDKPISDSGRYEYALHHEMYGIDVGSKILGKISFYNLRQDELGLLLWSVELNNDSDQLLGSGKSYGYGRVHIDISKVECWLNYDELPINSRDIFKKNNTQLINKDNYISYYQKILCDFIGQDINENERLQNFFRMKSMKCIPENDVISYSGKTHSGVQYIFPTIQELTSDSKWLVISREVADDIRESLQEKQITWDEFLLMIKEDKITGYHQKNIAKVYKELSELLLLFRASDKYIIRREIYDEYISIVSLYDKNRELNLHKDMRIIDGPLSSHIEKCVQLISNIKNEFKNYNRNIREESIPKISVDIFQLDEKDNKSLRLNIINDRISAPAKIRKIDLYYNKELVDTSDEPFYLEGGNNRIIEIKLEKVYENYFIRIKYEYNILGHRFSDQYENIISAKNNLKEFKRYKNPYVNYVGAPIADSKMFFGRDKIVGDIISYISNCSGNIITGRNIIIYGQKRSGKSSVMYFVQKRLNEDLKNKYITVNIGNIGSFLNVNRETNMIDLRILLRKIIDSIESTIEDDFDDIYEELEKKGIYFPNVNKVNEDEAMVICNNFLEKLNKMLLPNKRLVLLLDEFTYIYDGIINKQINEGFMKFWKAFIQNSKICAVLIGQDYMESFINQFPNEFGASNIIRLTYLTNTAASRLVQKPFVRDNKINIFEKEAVEYIYSLTAGSAYYIMHLCADMIQYINDYKYSGYISKNFIDDFLYDTWYKESSNQRKQGAFFESLYTDGLYKEWIDNNIVIMHQIAVQGEKNDWSDKDLVLKKCISNIPNALELINQLCNRDVLSYKNNHLKIRVQLFKMWLINQYGR